MPWLCALPAHASGVQKCDLLCSSRAVYAYCKYRFEKYNLYSVSGRRVGGLNLCKLFLAWVGDPSCGSAACMLACLSD